jgi:hypothetical protein
MSDEKFYFGSVKLAKGTIKKNIVQVNRDQTSVCFVNKPILSHSSKSKILLFGKNMEFANINLLKWPDFR